MNRFLHEVELNSLDVSNLMWDIQQTCVTSEDIEHLWEIKQVWLVKNKDLEERYDRKRKLMKSLGRTDDEVKDDLLFMAEGFNNVQRLVEIGPRCREKKNNVLGDTQYGIHMNRHYDILTRFMVFKNFQQANYLVILRGMLGRVKEVKPFFSGEYGCIAPTPNYDCHLAENQPDLTSIDISDAIAYNFAYMYEYDEETIIPMDYPSHVLPIAVLRLHRTRNRLDRTVLLNHTRERDFVNSKKAPRLKNETKPLKLLPRSAPHKTYIVEGRRSGTKLISDVPIEPPSDNTPEETMKKLERFRRPSALSGGTGMGHMFFKVPFNKMPTTWQRMFRFSRRGRGARSARPPLKSIRRRSRSRSRSPSRDDDRHRRSRSKSPKPLDPRHHRQKNLFELFGNTHQDHTILKLYNDEIYNEDVTQQKQNGFVVDKNSSVSCIDTGCQTGDHRSTGNSTPTQDEPHCNEVSISVSSAQDHGRDMYTETGVRHNSHITRMCVDQGSQSIDNNHFMRPHEFPNGYTPERLASVHESPRTDTGKTVSMGTQHRSAPVANTEKAMTYQLIRITLDQPDTPSIYHTLRGIKIPPGEKKTVKDPRLLRAMGHVVETPIMAGFGPFLRRIKEEPPDDDESYGEKQEKKTKNILPVEFVKTEPQNEPTEDDVEKVLHELNNAIKAMQDNSLGNIEVDNIKKEPVETENNSDRNNKGDEESDKQSDNEGEQDKNPDSFLPRNRGFSSYLPEYNADFERTARVLTEVFSEKAPSPPKKVMSMSDYFGITDPSDSKNPNNDEENNEGKLSDNKSSCGPTRSVQVCDETVEKKEEESIHRENEMAKTKLPSKHNESKKKEKHGNKSSKTKIKTFKQKKSGKKGLTSGKHKSELLKFNNNEDLVVTINRSRSRSVKSRSRSRSPSTSLTSMVKSVVRKRSRSRSRSLSKFDRDHDRTRSKSPKYKREKREKHFSRSPSTDRTSFRSRPESHHSYERKRSQSPSCARSTSSHDSGTKSKHRHKSTSSFTKTSKDSKSARMSLAEEIFERENSPGRLKYLEERKKVDRTRRYIINPNYQDDTTRMHHHSHSNPQAFGSHYEKHRSSYVDLTKETEDPRISERKASTTKDEAVVNTTLSKAMTSLLKKIVFRDNSNQDDSAEGRMADMVIELVKDQMSKELKSELKPNMESASASVKDEHPFVPYLKQERGVESLYSTNPWNSSTSSSRQDMSSRLEFPDKFMETKYEDERADSRASVSYPSRGRYIRRGHSGFSSSDHHSESSRGSFRGKLLSVRTMRKMRGSSYRGGLTFYRGGFQTRGFRGGFRARSRGHSHHTSSSYRYSFKEKRGFDKR